MSDTARLTAVLADRYRVERELVADGFDSSERIPNMSLRRVLAVGAVSISLACSAATRLEDASNRPAETFVTSTPPGAKLLVGGRTLTKVTPTSFHFRRPQVEGVPMPLHVVALPLRPTECRQLFVIGAKDAPPDTIKFDLDRCPRNDQDYNRIFEADELDERPIRLRGPMPDYPRFLLQTGQEGRVLVRVVIDTAGMPETASLEVVEASDSGFITSATQSALGSVFKPGLLLGRKVRTRILFPVVYKIRGRDCSLPSNAMTRECVFPRYFH